MNKAQLRQHYKEIRKNITPALRAMQEAHVAHISTVWLEHILQQNPSCTRLAVLYYMPLRFEFNICCLFDAVHKLAHQYNLSYDMYFPALIQAREACLHNSMVFYKLEPCVSCQQDFNKLLDMQRAPEFLLHPTKIFSHDLQIYQPLSLSFSNTTLYIVYTPGLCFTAHGERLGYGGGYYDRFLETITSDVHERCISVACCYTEQLCLMLPCEKHDKRIDYLISSKGCLRAI